MDAPAPQTSPTPPKENSVGPLVGIVIIVALLVAGGIYFFLMEQKENEQGLGEEQASNTQDNLLVSPNAI